MKILHLSSVYAPHAVGGAEKVVEVLAEGAAALGHEVSVAHLVPQPAPAAQRHGVAVRPLAHRNPLWIQDSARYPGPVRNLNKVATLCNVLTAWDFERVLRELRPDVVHTHSMVELTPAMWALARRHGATLVHTLHDYDLLCIRAALFHHGRACERQHLACRLFSQVKRHFHRHIDHVVGVSQAILDIHLAQGCFDALLPTQRHVVWNPVRGAQRPVRAVRQPGVPLTFGFMGRLVEEKGLQVLLDACRRLPPGGWRLRVAGRLPEDSPWREAARGLPVEWLGYVDAASFLAEVDTLVVPSVWQEPFGLTIVEAYTQGVPVLGSDIGGITELIGAVDPAALVRPNDAQALAQRMSALIAQGVRPLAAEPLERLLARVRPAAVVDDYLTIYQMPPERVRSAAPALPLKGRAPVIAGAADATNPRQ
ncbi:glycosyltransferase family 4 protein [Azohydromonas caseinilytica]|uniref:Glycosyltransferase family 4 protein n=1 Tax=Azohydromonas caseinilytica TaxID=2728836 RepID=A0A848FF91_9BURK|nr:glycosyltransferase family 4 protein [Azohydromonas caseinilytica]NML17776.1 glycosyltransferase family 4 protein [Azohydromonas caseinilytica]